MTSRGGSRRGLDVTEVPRWTCPECQHTFKRADVHQAGSISCKAYQVAATADEQDLVPVDGHEREIRLKLSLCGLITLMPGKPKFGNVSPRIEWKGNVRKEIRREVKATPSLTYPYAPEWAVIVCRVLNASSNDKGESVSGRVLSLYKTADKKDQLAIVSVFRLGGAQAVLNMMRELHPDLGLMNINFNVLDEEF